MKHSHGNLIAIAFPILVLASVAGAGWYYYNAEVDKNQILSMEISTQQGILKTDLENLQTRINILLENEAALQARLVSEQESQGELAASLEKTVADKKAMETRLQQEVKKVILTTAELEAELEKRRAEQKSLHNEIITVSGENSQLLDQLEQEQESKRHITSLKSRLELELNDRLLIPVFDPREILFLQSVYFSGLLFQQSPCLTDRLKMPALHGFDSAGRSTP